MDNKHYDVIIIGTGIGGLTLGALLASRNKKILLLERHKNIGGYCSGFKRKEFFFDSSLHSINGCYKNGSVYNILRKCNIISKVSFLQPKYLCRSIFPDYDIRVAQNDYKSFIKTLVELFPKEREGLNDFFEMTIKIFNEIKYLETKNSMSKKNLFLLEWSNKSFGALLDEFLQSKELKAILSQYWVYCGIPPSKLSCLYYCYMWGDFILNGAYYPKGGSQALCDSLARRIIEENNTILTKKSAIKIIVDNNYAIGVETDDGEVFYAKKVVSNADIRLTINKLLNCYTLPSAYKKVVNNTEVSISAFKVYLGMNSDIKTQNSSDYEIFLNPSYDLDKQYEASLKNMIDKAPMGITIYSNLSPLKDKFILSLTVLSGYEYWKSKTEREYKKIKIKFADKLLKRAEKILPGITKKIKVLEIATPLTMERYTANSKGAIYGWRKEELRNSLKKVSQVTPIKNLYFTSNWTRKGGGISGVMRSSEIVDKLLK